MMKKLHKTLLLDYGFHRANGQYAHIYMDLHQPVKQEYPQYFENISSLNWSTAALLTGNIGQTQYCFDKPSYRPAYCNQGQNREKRTVFLIAVIGIHKRFGETTALGGVSFEVASGTSFGLLGPNGAGKTTTVSILCGLLESDAGTVALAGRTDPTQPEVRSILGVVPQALALYEELSAERNLHFFGSMYGLTGKSSESP